MTDQKIAVVSTSINARPEAYERWANQTEDVMLIVAGDLNTPKELGSYVDDLGGIYLAPSDQDEWEVSDKIGWRSIQRRNIAILEALKRGADFIITVDDDNAPLTETYVNTMLRAQHNDMARTDDICPHVAPTGFFDPGALCIPQTRARGLPYDINRDLARIRGYKCDCGQGKRVGVVAGLWVGDPDIDAIERMANAPTVERVLSNAFVRHTYAPLNSQSTGWLRELAPLMAVLPHIGRMDDIWAGYIAQRILYSKGFGIRFGYPLVQQDRNDHNLVKDLKAEVRGYEYTGDLCRFIDTLRLHPEDDVISQYEHVAIALDSQVYFPTDTVDFMLAWVRDARKALAA